MSLGQQRSVSRTCIFRDWGAISDVGPLNSSSSLRIQSLVWTFYLVMRMSHNEKDTVPMVQVAASQNPNKKKLLTTRHKTVHISTFHFFRDKNTLSSIKN